MRPRRPRLRWAVAAAVVLTLAPLSACGHHSAAPVPAASSSATPSVSRAAVTTASPIRVSYRSVSGRLPAGARSRLAHQLERVVGRWWDAAYLTDRPVKSFPVFTPAAARLAQRQAPLMTSSLQPGTTISVVRREMGIDALAVRRHAVGADVVVDLVYRTGTPRATYHVHGTVSLTPTAHGWRVFAFDIRKSRERS